MKVFKHALIGLCGALGVAGGWYYTSLQPLAPDAPVKVFFTVSEGASVKQVATQLENQGLIKSGDALVWYARLHKLDRKVTAGRFSLSPSMSGAEIVASLTTPGEVDNVVITFPEGFTTQQMIDRVIEKKLATRGEMKPTKNQEGYLFPDTYHFDPATFTPQLFFDTLNANFEAQTKTLHAAADAEKKDWATVVQIAAMLEKEARHAEDFPVIAGIILKRLNAGWPLGIDATLLYTDADGVLTAEDLAKDSPYNTRTRTGLPPTPIANPGLKALTAALNPSTTPYWFYITDPATGKAVYAITHEQHEKNVARFIH
jgi:UPF0755 protein